MPAPRPAPRYAVIIPHYNDLDRLTRCLTALCAQALDATEVVVADNASPVDPASLAARFPRVRFVRQTKKGAAESRNKGVEESTAPWLFFLDADCVPGPDWLDQARRVAQAGGTMRLVGGRIDVFDETDPPRSGAEAFETVFAFDQAGYIRDKGFSVTANLVTSRALFAATGPMVAGLSEDVDWCRRAVRAGGALSYEAALAVAHPTRADWPALAKKWRRLTAESFALGGMGPAHRLSWAGRACLMPLSVLAHLPRVLAHPKLRPGEKARGAGMLARLRLARMGWMLRQAVTGRA